MKLSDLLDRLPFSKSIFEPGHVWLAGAGPGNVGSLTLDVLAAIADADAIIYDALVNPDVLKVARNAELVFAGKRGGQVSAAQEAINGKMAELARQGNRVLRLKGGDPYVFGRGGEEALFLAGQGIPFRVLPGLTSAFAALAGVNIPTTMRGKNRAIILATGHGAESPQDPDWHAIARTGQPVIIYMGLTNLKRISASLVDGGMPPDMPAAIIMSASTPEERVLVATASTLYEAARSAGFKSPSLIIFGSIVGVREQLTSAFDNGKQA